MNFLYYLTLFFIFCIKKNLKKFKSGKYIFKSGSSLNDIINELRVPANRKTIDFSFNSFDDFSHLAFCLSHETSIFNYFFKYY